MSQVFEHMDWSVLQSNQKVVLRLAQHALTKWTVFQIIQATEAHSHKCTLLDDNFYAWRFRLTIVTLDRLVRYGKGDCNQMGNRFICYDILIVLPRTLISNIFHFVPFHQQTTKTNYRNKNVVLVGISFWGFAITSKPICILNKHAKPSIVWLISFSIENPNSTTSIAVLLTLMSSKMRANENQIFNLAKMLWEKDW